jgi:hypothetical protein
MAYRARTEYVAAALVTAAVLLLFAGRGAAQISGASVSTSTCTGSPANNADGFTGCSAAIQVNNGTTLSTRFAFNVNADAPVFVTRDQTGSATHRVTFNVTAPGGYRLDISTSRVGDINRVNDFLNCDGSADTSGVTGTTSFPLTSGSLNLPDPGVINPCGGFFGCGTGGTTNVPYNQSSGTAQLFRVSNGAAQSHTLTFTFNASARSNSCEAAVRVGQQNGTTTSCGACEYPGSPSRTQANDGHFVTVTRVNLCGNGVIDTEVGEQCDLGGANGSPFSCCTSSCQLRAAGQTCRAAAGDCDVAETCTGSSPTCPADDFLPSGVTCRAASPGDDCDEDEECDGLSAFCPADLVKPFGTVCRGLQGECDVAEVCDGVSKQCPFDDKQSPGTPCTSDGNPCTADVCDGVSDFCQHPAGNAGAVCRAAAAVCDVAETCNGISTTCPADQFKSSTTVCRAAADDCDEAELCPGNGPSCPADDKKPSGTPCADDGEVCTVDECDGVSDACQHTPGNAGVECRGVTAGEECDEAEFCDGISPTCPADDVLPSGTPCTDDGEVCTADECDGVSKLCQHPAGNAGVQCRAAGGECDVAELCDGVSPTCPPDDFEPGGTPCGDPSDTDCTDPDTCDGSGACQSNDAADGTACNDGEVCTDGETCTGGVCSGGLNVCPSIDHYKCYQGKDLKDPKFNKITVNTSDQIILSEAVEVKKLKFVCAPVDKNGEGINDPDTHLACYQIKAPNLGAQPSVEVDSQFQTSRFRLKKGKLICLPATKTVLP